MASADVFAIARYDQLTAGEIAGKLNELSEIDLAKVDAYERRHQDPHGGALADRQPARKRAVARLGRARRAADPDRAERRRR